MTREAFNVLLTKKFPQFLKPDDTELDDIMDFITGFSDSDLTLLWEEFRDTYSAGYSPRRAVFVKMAGQLNLRREGRGKNRSVEFVCYVCDNRFPTTLTVCPRCGNGDKAWRAGIYVGDQRYGKLKEEIDSSSEARVRAVYPKNPTNDVETNRRQAEFLAKTPRQQSLGDS